MKIIYIGNFVFSISINFAISNVIVIGLIKCDRESSCKRKSNQSSSKNENY
jgi:hypothetical protein